MRVLFMCGFFLLGAAEAATHTVRAGQTLYSIARLSNTSVEELIRINNLQSSTLQTGQILDLGQGVMPPAQAGQTSFTPQTSPEQNFAPQTGPEQSVIRAASTRHLNVPYVWAGVTEQGLDCSGFTSLVMSELGIRIPRTSTAQFGSGTPIDRSDLREGDLLFFNTTGKGVSHVAIYLGGGEMIGANSVSGRVMIEPVFSSPYWNPRYLGARRYLN